MLPHEFCKIFKNTCFVKYLQMVAFLARIQKQPSRGVLRKRNSENMQQIYREHPCRSVISIKLQSNFNEITLRHGCSLVNLLHIFRVPFLKNISGRLLLQDSITWRKVLSKISQFLLD